MAQIKSALEIALARTENVASDKEGLRLKELEEKGKKIASVYLNDHQDAKKLKTEISAFSGEDKKIILKAARTVLDSNFTLPAYDDFSIHLKILEEGYTALSGDPNQMATFFKEVAGFFKQYTDAKNQLAEALKARLEQVAKTKSQQVAAQTGMQMEIPPESLPEYAKAYRENLAKISEQYKEALDQVKEGLREI